MMRIKFKTAYADCMQTEVTGADEWDAAPPKIVFNVVNEVKIGDETRKAIIATGATYHMKVPLKANEFEFNREIGSWTRFFDDDTPQLDESVFEEYGWDLEYEEFDEAGTSNQV